MSYSSDVKSLQMKWLDEKAFLLTWNYFRTISVIDPAYHELGVFFHQYLWKS